LPAKVGQLWAALHNAFSVDINSLAARYTGLRASLSSNFLRLSVLVPNVPLDKPMRSIGARRG
jgi:hypothetical protein